MRTRPGIPSRGSRIIWGRFRNGRDRPAQCREGESFSVRKQDKEADVSFRTARTSRTAGQSTAAVAEDGRDLARTGALVR